MHTAYGFNGMYDTSWQYWDDPTQDFGTRHYHDKVTYSNFVDPQDIQPATASACKV